MVENFCRIGALVGVILLVAACSSSGKLNITHEKVGAIGANKTVSLNIVQGADVGSTRVVQRLRSELFGRLVAEHVFSQVVHTNETADYKLDVVVVEGTAVSGAARVLLGVFAGSNRLKCNVTLIDQGTGQTRTAFQVEGVSASHPMSSESGLDDAVREAVINMIIALR